MSTINDVKQPKSKRHGKEHIECGKYEEEKKNILPPRLPLKVDPPPRGALCVLTFHVLTLSTVASTSASCATMARLVARAITVKDVIANSAEHEESKEKVDVDCYVSMKYRGMRNDEIQPPSSCAQ